MKEYLWQNMLHQVKRWIFWERIVAILAGTNLAVGEVSWHLYRECGGWGEFCHSIAIRMAADVWWRFARLNKPAAALRYLE